MKRFKIIAFAFFIGVFLIGSSAYSQDDKSKNKKEKKAHEDKSKAGQGIDTGWEATKKGTKIGAKETKEFFKGEETEEDRTKKLKRKQTRKKRKPIKQPRKTTKI